MSNAEAAAAAKTAIAAKFSAITAALKSLNTATIASTVSTKAHAVAQGVASLAAKAATAAHTAFVAISNMVSASHAKAALTAGVAGVANVALGATTKVVAAGYLAASAAATAFCAIPITWILIAVVGALVGVCAYMASATKHTAELSEEMGKMREKGDDLRTTDQLRMERLEQLAEKEKLSAAEMDEAEKIAGQLQARYGDLGIGLDRMSGKLSMATDAQDRFNEAMKQQAIHQIEAEINELSNNISELYKENESLCGVWVNTWNVITFRGDKAAKDIEANGEKISAAYEKMRAAQARLDAIKGGDKDAVTGGKGEKEKLQEKVDAERSKKGAARSEAESAATRILQIEKKLAREQCTELENEISDIKELRDEYKKLLTTVLSYEKSKKEKDLKKIADLEAKLAQADATAEKRIAKAEAKARKKFDDEVAELQDNFDSTASDIEKSRAEGEQDREIDDALKSDKEVGIKLISEMLHYSQSAAEEAKEAFAQIMKESTADGELTDDEKKRIEKAQEAYRSAESMVDKYASKLRSAQEETQKSATSTKPQGTFYARAAAALVGNQMELRRTQAAEETVRQVKKTNQLLKDMDGGGSMTFS